MLHSTSITDPGKFLLASFAAVLLVNVAAFSLWLVVLPGPIKYVDPLEPSGKDQSFLIMYVMIFLSLFLMPE
jgi:hypothetical protein